MGNAREIRRSNSSSSSTSSPGAEPPALPPRPVHQQLQQHHLQQQQTLSSESLSSGRNSNNAIVSSSSTAARIVDSSNHDSVSTTTGSCNPCGKKYVLLCAACGGLAIILGSLFAVLYVVLRSYTSSLHYFETVPSYVASVALIATGLLMLCFGWRRNRFGYLVKLCGACCLVCAVVCVVITVTTTVVHMNRLQTLRECVYNARGRSCTCFTGSSLSVQHQAASSGFNPVIDSSHHDQGSAKYVFADTPDCEVVHGALYACLRALFGLSVIGILVSLFSGMLVYQLLGHERKKMYWEQLELRSRALFRRGQHHPPPCCGCCQDCRFAPTSAAVAAAAAANNPMLAWPPHWDPVLDDSNRYWSLHGGNLYSPGPCANAGMTGMSGSSTCSGHGGINGGGCPAAAHHRRSSNPAWNWLPWRPSVADSSSDVNSTLSSRVRRAGNEQGPVIIGPDDHYGFPLSGNSNYRSPLALAAASPAIVGVAERVVAGWGPPPPYSRGSSSELGSISASTPIGSPVRISPESGKRSVHPAGPFTVGGGGTAGASSASTPVSPLSRKDVLVNLPQRQTSKAASSVGLHSSPVGRMHPDPRRKPWSPQTAGMNPIISHGHSNSYPALSRNVSMTQQQQQKPTGSPSGIRDNGNMSSKLLGETDIYFGDASSYTISSVHNDGSNSSAMYEEITGHRYDKIQRPLVKVTSIRSNVSSGSASRPFQRSSWDGQNQQQQQQLRPFVGVHLSPSAVGQPRSRHSADTVSKEKVFSPIAVPNAKSQPPPYINCPTQPSSNWTMTPETPDTCSFVPYRRAAVIPATNGNGNVPTASRSFTTDGEVYENVTNLDFDDNKRLGQSIGHQPRTLSPDEEVAILTSRAIPAPVELDVESTQIDSESDDNESIMRAVNV